MTADAPARLRIHGERGTDGEVRSTFLVLLSGGGEAAVLLSGGGEADELLPLPAGALSAVFARYGRPLDEELCGDARNGAGMEVWLGRRRADEKPGRDPGDEGQGRGQAKEEQGEGQANPEQGRGQGVLRAFVFKPFGWVVPADYLALFVEGQDEPLVAPAPLCAAALTALCRAAAGRT